MRRCVLLLVAIASATAIAPSPAWSDGETPAAPGTPAPVAARRAWPGDAGTIVLATGATLVGRVIALTRAEEVVELTSGARLRFPPGTVLGLADPLPPAPPGDDREELLLSDGRVLRGVVLGRDAETLTLRVGKWDERRIPLAQIVDRRPSPRWGFEEPMRDPVRSRVLASPTALGLERGEVALGLSAFVQPSLTAGLPAGVQLRASGVVPSLYAADDAFSGAVALQAGFSPARRIHLAGGVSGALERSGAAAFAFGVATFGTPDGYLSFYAGPPAVSAAHVDVVSDVVFSLGGALRLHRYGGVVAEQWLAPRDGQRRLLSSVAGRAFVGGLALDVGVLVAYRDGPTDTAPWLAVSFTGVPSRLF